MHNRLDSSLAERLLREAQDELIQNFKDNGSGGISMGNASAAIGTGAIVAASRDSGLSTEAIRNELKMLDNKDR